MGANRRCSAGKEGQRGRWKQEERKASARATLMGLQGECRGTQGLQPRTEAHLFLGHKSGQEFPKEDVKLDNDGFILCQEFHNPVSPAHSLPSPGTARAELRGTRCRGTAGWAQAGSRAVPSPPEAAQVPLHTSTTVCRDVPRCRRAAGRRDKQVTGRN